ncbi:MAG TPA: TolC family protein [Gemmatimonadales bacterium]|jgi:outer membrane protein TolC
MTGRASRVISVLGILASGAAADLWAQQPRPRALSLEDALELAVPASDGVAIARADVRRAEGEVKRVRADLLPQLTGTASYTRTIKSQFNLGSGRVDSTATTSCDRFSADPSLPIGQRVDSLERTVECLSALNPFAALADLPFGRKNQYNLGLSFSQTLFSSSILKGRPKAAVAGRRLARLGVTTAEAQAQLNVTQGYFDAVLTDRLAAIAELSLAQAETTLAQTRLARQVGTKPEFDQLRATVTRDNQRAIVLQRRSQRTLAFLRLNQLLGLPLEQPLILTTTLDEVPGVDVERPDSLGVIQGDTSVSHRAAVQQAEEAVTIQKVLTDVTRWDRLPTVTLKSAFARIGYPKDGLPWNADFVSDWTVGVSLSVPLWTSGRLTGNTWVAEASLAQAQARASQARDGAALDSHRAVEQLQTALASWSATQGTVAQAERAYEIATIRYQEGISTQTELTDARLQLAQAQANRAVAARDVQVARARLRLLRDLPLEGAEVAQTLSNAATGLQNSQQSAPSTGTAGTNGTTP